MDTPGAVPTRNRIYAAAVAAGGLACAVVCLLGSQGGDFLVFCLHTGLIAVLSSMAVPVPAGVGRLSTGFLAVLLATASLPHAEAVLACCAGTLMQCLWRGSKLSEAPFRCGAATLAGGNAALVYGLLSSHGTAVPLSLVVAAFVYFGIDTAAVAGFTATREGKNVRVRWREAYQSALPCYMLGAPIAWAIVAAASSRPWIVPLAGLPAALGISRLCRLYLRRSDDSARRIEEMRELHLRTIQALARAIDARDFQTHGHNDLAPIYAAEIGQELGVSREEQVALRAAAMLRNIGKLAVPEHIIFKPGKLTPEEYERVKVHPVVGSQILEHIQFPYPMAAIVRSYHENYDGTGYPDGLQGEAIPIGARILAVVSCFDALTSDRRYRTALPADQVLKIITSQAGAMFDPKVVDAFARKYPRFQAMLGQRNNAGADGSEPRSAAEHEPPAAEPAQSSVLSLIAGAYQEGQLLFELSRELGSSLNLEDTLAVTSTRLKRLVQFDALVVWLLDSSLLRPAWVEGCEAKFLSLLEVPLGQGPSGWTAQNRLPLVNGVPAKESDQLGDTELESALCVPLESAGVTIGVLTLYSRRAEAFTKDDLRLMLAVSSKVQLTIDNALKYRQAEDDAATDCITQLPNARTFWARLESELSRARAAETPLAVIVGDLDGFKQLNDTCGHLRGDMALRAAGDLLRACCGPGEFVARLGGDEFVMICPDGDNRDVFPIMTRIRAAIQRGVGGPEAMDPLSMTLGWAIFPDDAETADELVRKADLRMYGLKRVEKGLTEPGAGAPQKAAVHRICG